MLPALRLSQYAIEQTAAHADRIRTLVRMESPALTLACSQHGLPLELSRLCGGLLASMVDDMIAVSRLPHTDFERTKRKERLMAVAAEPYACALKLAMAASPINGRAAVAHWDVICEKYEVGKLAWLLGMDTDTSWRYAKKIEKMQK